MSAQASSGPVHRSNLRATFIDNESYTATLIVALVETYGTEFFQWAPETIMMAIERDFNLELPRAVGDRIMAGVVLITTDKFYKSLPDFVALCNVLSGDLYDPRTFDPADAEEIAWGITEAILLSPPEDDDENPFTEEIVGYIGAVLDQEGIIHPPDVLKIAVRDVDPTAAANSYSDDPIMFAAIYDAEESKTSAINSIIRENLRALAGQLGAMSLRNGSTAQVIEQMLKSFGQNVVA